MTGGHFLGGSLRTTTPATDSICLERGVQTGFARARGQDAGESFPERWRTHQELAYKSVLTIQRRVHSLPSFMPESGI